MTDRQAFWERSLDIRDIEPGQTYYVITSDDSGGRCILNGMFIAVWLDRKIAIEYRTTLGTGHQVVKQVKPEVKP